MVAVNNITTPPLSSNTQNIALVIIGAATLVMLLAITFLVLNAMRNRKQVLKKGYDESAEEDKMQKKNKLIYDLVKLKSQGDGFRVEEGEDQDHTKNKDKRAIYCQAPLANKAELVDIKWYAENAGFECENIEDDGQDSAERDCFFRIDCGTKKERDEILKEVNSRVKRKLIDAMVGFQFQYGITSFKKRGNNKILCYGTSANKAELEAIKKYAQSAGFSCLKSKNTEGDSYSFRIVCKTPAERDEILDAVNSRVEAAKKQQKVEANNNITNNTTDTNTSHLSLTDAKDTFGGAGMTRVGSNNNRPKSPTPPTSATQ